jgi:hypothetical protein
MDGYQTIIASTDNAQIGKNELIKVQAKLDEHGELDVNFDAINTGIQRSNYKNYAKNKDSAVATNE